MVKKPKSITIEQALEDIINSGTICLLRKLTQVCTLCETIPKHHELYERGRSLANFVITGLNKLSNGMATGSLSTPAHVQEELKDLLVKAHEKYEVVFRWMEH